MVGIACFFFHFQGRGISELFGLHTFSSSQLARVYDFYDLTSSHPLHVYFSPFTQYFNDIPLSFFWRH
jgi:hypothetical protein